MAIERLLLVIADIGGYTRFMNLHRVSLSHAQDVVAQLLEAVIEGAGKPFEVAKLEGDAVFLYARVPPGKEPDLALFAERLQRMRTAFLERQLSIAQSRMCTCDGCVQAEALKLKFVSHLGEAAFQRIRRFVELAGVDVILVHRMLKNSVPLREYVLVSDALEPQLKAELRSMAQPLEEDFEGLGRHRTHYIDLNQLGPVALPTYRPSLLRRLWALLLMNLRSLPYFAGVKDPCEGFRCLPDIQGTPARLPGQA